MLESSARCSVHTGQQNVVPCTILRKLEFAMHTHTHIYIYIHESRTFLSYIRDGKMDTPMLMTKKLRRITDHPIVVVIIMVEILVLATITVNSNDKGINGNHSSPTGKACTKH